MLYHCGLLSERPEKDATLQWVRRGAWDLPGHPPEIEFERRVWLAMPGFNINYHVETLGVGRSLVLRHIGRDYEELKEAVAENWRSCTREDAIRLAVMRPGKGDVPVICQLKIMDDIKAGVSPSEIMRAYRVTRSTITVYGSRGIRPGRSFIPEGFQLIRS